MAQESSKSVLYIDDEDSNIFMFEMLFKDIFDLKTAKSGIDGLEMLKSEPNIGVVISDMNMPKMNGLEFIDRARKDFEGISYFILSGYSINKNIKEALAQGWLSGYMTKPLDYEEILSAVVEASSSN